MYNCILIIGEGTAGTLSVILEVQAECDIFVQKFELHDSTDFVHKQ